MQTSNLPLVAAVGAAVFSVGAYLWNTNAAASSHNQQNTDATIATGSSTSTASTRNRTTISHGNSTATTSNFSHQVRKALMLHDFSQARQLLATYLQEQPHDFEARRMWFSHFTTTSTFKHDAEQLQQCATNAEQQIIATVDITRSMPDKSARDLLATVRQALTHSPNSVNLLLEKIRLIVSSSFFLSM